jgi:hypothetical protein
MGNLSMSGTAGLASSGKTSRTRKQKASDKWVIETSHVRDFIGKKDVERAESRRRFSSEDMEAAVQEFQNKQETK